MPQLIEAEDRTQAEERRDEQRAVLRLCLDEVASEVTAALQEADLSMPVHFAVTSSGDAVMTFMTPEDPSDADWSELTQIVCDVVAGKLGVSGLTGQSLACAATCASVKATEASAGGLNQQHAGDAVLGS